MPLGKAVALLRGSAAAWYRSSVFVIAYLGAKLTVKASFMGQASEAL